MDGSVVNVALPTLQSTFHATSGAIQWVVQGYALFAAALLLLGGAIGDHYGRRRTFVFGVVLFALASAGCAASYSLGQLIADLTNYPQTILNVKVREKLPLNTFPTIVAAIAAAEADLSTTGRVVIRYSGTEALARVMIEAESAEAMHHHATTIANAIRTELGV